MVRKQERLSEKEAQYWANVAVSCSQIFFGIFGVTLFTGKFDLVGILTLILSLLFAIICWIIGWRFQK